MVVDAPLGRRCDRSARLRALFMWRGCLTRGLFVEHHTKPVTTGKDTNSVCLLFSLVVCVLNCLIDMSIDCVGSAEEEFSASRLA